jgi:hypothetical protein
MKTKKLTLKSISLSLQATQKQLRETRDLLEVIRSTVSAFPPAHELKMATKCISDNLTYTFAKFSDLEARLSYAENTYFPIAAKMNRVNRK